MGVCCPFLRPWDRARDRFLLNIPCLSDPVRRSSLLLKLALVALHLVFVGFLFFFDEEFIEKTKRDPWYMASYFLLFSVTLLQYFITSGSSPGYVVDAMRDVCEANAVYGNTPATISIQHASRKSESLVVTVEGESASNARRTPASPWGKLVLDLYPPGTSIRNLTCSYCHVEQLPNSDESKHLRTCEAKTYSVLELLHEADRYVRVILKLLRFAGIFQNECIRLAEEFGGTYTMSVATTLI
ncbi:unnamed protein product [Arabis nemorensis]|uniref:Uncharacterized protein n=1 Tax=Arabis nemorensis TaxID=586526 RepID=A0A565BVF3_9BRAS|nr:unnamed protein product [Arabis nemorensis]